MEAGHVRKPILRIQNLVYMYLFRTVFTKATAAAAHMAPAFAWRLEQMCVSVCVVDAGCSEMCGHTI